MEKTHPNSRTCWFVGAAFKKTEDQSERFIREGIWENDNTVRYVDKVKAMQPGDRIAIKATYTRRNGLPFDNRGNSVSVMAIKAIGTVKENPGDGRNLKVDWTPVAPAREWYFYTFQKTVWRVVPGDVYTDSLIAFAFEGKPQDIDLFRNEPYWRGRFGNKTTASPSFGWTAFYEAIAEKLLDHRHDRSKLVTAIHGIASRVDGLTILQDHFADGTVGPIRDICPFTTIGLFNRGITDENRKKIAAEFAAFLGVNLPVPDTFSGIPTLNNQRTWFYDYEKDRKPEDIPSLWNVFEKAIRLSEFDDEDARTEFTEAYTAAARVNGVGWNLSMGLYWIRPWNFVALDSRAQRFLTKKLSLQIGKNGPKSRCSAEDYLSVLDTLNTRFKEPEYPVHSFPEFSLAAWLYKDDSEQGPNSRGEPPEQPGENTEGEPESAPTVPPMVPYSLDNVIADGCFLSRDRLESIMNSLRTKKNLILQGSPGTGKTWLAKRLGFALIGQKDEGKLRAVQFHPNLSYEDFIRGFRPNGQGRLDLIDGPFMEMIAAAKDKPDTNHVIVIEEINRGNPAQIFGEMLTLLEADKRTPSEALELSYRRFTGERISIPSNLYVIGTMNIADRSLALVDIAFRRRFAFIDLEPIFGSPWRSWVTEKFKLDSAFLEDIEVRLGALNATIEGDTGLGRQFRIGHSFVTPSSIHDLKDPAAWFRQVVETQIGPLLEEYWFDDLDKAHKSRDALLVGI